MAASTVQVNVTGRDDLSPALNQIESKLIRFVGAVSAAMAAISVVGFPVAAASDFQKELLNVQKTIENIDLSRLGRELKDLSLRMNVSVVDLAKIAAAAGQLGLGREGVTSVVQFTESVARMASVLDVSAEEAATGVGKIINIFHLALSETENVVSGFNEASNNSTASGQELLDVVRRIGDAAGTINLKESLGLAATGIDFGMSPEVVGTSYGKIFADMRAKADEFGKIMNMSATEWITLIETRGGIEAYKKYLARLRQLSSQDQARAISELNGRGRIFALVNKNVQDTSDSLLNKNLRFAAEGVDGGTSALKEQQTVMQGLGAQVQILRNSIFALGTDAGDQLLGPLTTYVAQLSAALQTPAVKSFIIAIGQSMLSVVEAVVSAIKFVADLNINWENFIVLAKVFIGVKIIEFFGGIVARATAATAATLGYARSQTAAAAASRAAGAAGAAAAAQQADGLTRLRAAYAADQAARAARLAAEQANSAAIIANRRRETEMLRIAGQEVPLNRKVRNASRAVTTASAGLTAATAAAAASQAQIQATYDRKMETSKRLHEQNLAAIQSSFAGRRSVADLANKQALIEAETRHFARQTTGYSTYYTRRLAADAATNAQLIANAQATAAATLTAQAGSQAALAGAIVNTNRARGALSASDQQARQTAAALLATQNAAQRTGASLLNVGTIAAGLAGFFGRLLGAVFPVVLVATLLYTILDSFGLLDDLPEFFTDLAIAMGFQEAQTKKLVLASRDLATKLKEQTNLVDELVAKYQKLKKVTGELDEGRLKDLTAAFTGNGSFDAQQQAVEKLGESLRAANAEKIALERSQATVKGRQNKAASDVETYRLELQAALKEKAAFDAFIAKGGNVSDNVLARTAERVSSATAAFNTARKNLELVKTQSGKDYNESIARADANIAKLQQTVGGLFTNDSAKLFKDYVFQQGQLNAEQARIIKEQSEASQKLISIGKGDGTASAAYDKQNLVITSLATQLEASKLKSVQFEAALKKAISQIPRVGKVSEDQMLRSIQFLDVLATATLQTQTDFFSAMMNIAGSQLGPVKGFTGALLPALAPTTSSGDDTVKDPSQSAARKLGKANLEFLKAQNAAEADLNRAKGDAFLASEQRMYDQGLRTVEEYYAGKLRVELEGIAAEQKAREADIAAIQKESATRKKEGAPADELKKFQTDIIKLRSDIAVANVKKAQLSTEITEEQRKASEAFRERISSTQIDLASTLGVTDLEAFFNLQLADYNSKYKVFIEQLKKDGSDASKQMILDIDAAGKVKALTEALRAADVAPTLERTEIERIIERLGVLRDTGSITTMKFEEDSALARKSLVAIYASSIQASKALIDGFTGDTSSTAFQQLLLDLDATRLKMEQIGATVNAVSAQINESFLGGIQEALKTLARGAEEIELTDAQQKVMADNEASINRLRDNIGFLERARNGVIAGYGDQTQALDAQLVKSRAEIASLQAEAQEAGKNSTESALDVIVRAAKGLGVTVADAMTEALTKNLAESAIQSLGGLGGGLGGLFTGLFGESERGTETKPMVIVPKNTGGDKFDPEKPVESVFDIFKKKAEDTFGSLGTTLSDIMGSFGTSFSDILGGVLESLFGGGAGGTDYIGAAMSFFGSFHSGGVVGRSFQPRLAHPGVFQNAMKYHSGGIAGLQPDEVPAILRKGEEVLTRGDARHRDNGGGAGGGTSVAITVNVESGEENTVADSDNAKELGKRITSLIVAEISNQKRPGGLLS